MSGRSSSKAFWAWWDERRVRLNELFPEAFPMAGERRPALATGIDKELARRASMSRRQTRLFLRAWTGRERYLEAVLRGGARVNLDGEPAGEITLAHQIHAQERLHTLWQTRRQRFVQQRKDDLAA